MPLKKVGALWLKEKNGQKYMSGQVSEAIAAGQHLLMFRNKYKQDGDNKPDYTLNIAEDDDGPQATRYPDRDRQMPPPAEDTPF